jgi:N-acetylglutamate synthase-like GNAT family acetyltransferase
MKNNLNTYTILRMHDHPGGLDEAIAYYHSKWGRENNYTFFEDAIRNSYYQDLPQFFVLLKDNDIVGCCGLIINDFISRHDLYPWLCGVFIEESERNQGLGGKILAFAEQEAKRVGYKAVYLSTDHTSYYERYGWEYIGDGYQPDGDVARIYRKKIKI